MAVMFILDGKPQTKQRLPYIPREGELIEIASPNGTEMYIVDLVQHRIDLKSTIGVVDTMIHITKKKGKKSDD